jgi:hypothetical protein
MTDLMLKWKRTEPGVYRASHVADGQTWIYQVGREHPDPYRERDSWYVAAWLDVELSGPAVVVRRTGFSKLELAEHNAAGTRCSECYEYRPLHELVLAREVTGRRGDRTEFFRCREREACDALAVKREAEERAALLHTDHTDIYVRDTEFGPELVFVTEGLCGTNSQTVQVTEADLAKLASPLERKAR